MAYDGLFIKNQINEFKKIILNENISKIYSVNNKEIDLIFRVNNKNINLSISVNPSFPYIYLKENVENNDKTPSGFAMLLRKYIKSGKILDIKQIRDINSPSIERIVDIKILNINEKGDYEDYHLIIELMGKYSNIILTDKNYIIIDLLNKPIGIADNKRVLLPQNEYSTKDIVNKIDIFDNEYNILSIDIIKNELKDKLKLLKDSKKDHNIIDLFISTFSGISKSYSIYKFNELNLDGFINIYDEYVYDLINKKDDILLKIIKSIYKDIMNIDKNNNKSYIFKENNKNKDFHIFDFSIYVNSYEKITFDDSSSCILTYYNNALNESLTSNEKKNIIQYAINTKNKLVKKLSIYEKELKDSNDYEKYKIYGELINAYGYDKNNIKNNELVCENYYTNEIVNIPLDMTKDISINANKYFNKYNKLKRTIESANELIIKTNKEIEHIDEIINSLSYISDTNDLFLIKKELNLYFNYTDKTYNKNIKKEKSSRLNYNISHYKSSSGIDIYVGKNNLQNEYLTFDIADSNDTWLHVKNRTGSHVIIKGSFEKIDMKTIEEAASLAAYFSELKNENKVTVDYTLRKELKKVKGKPPGFVIYNKNYSINVTPGIFIIRI